MLSASYSGGGWIGAHPIPGPLVFAPPGKDLPAPGYAEKHQAAANNIQGKPAKTPGVSDVTTHPPDQTRGVYSPSTGGGNPGGYSMSAKEAFRAWRNAQIGKRRAFERRFKLSGAPHAYMLPREFLAGGPQTGAYGTPSPQKRARWSKPSRAGSFSGRRLAPRLATYSPQRLAVKRRRTRRRTPGKQYYGNQPWWQRVNRRGN